MVGAPRVGRRGSVRSGVAAVARPRLAVHCRADLNGAVQPVHEYVIPLRLSMDLKKYPTSSVLCTVREVGA